MACQNLRTAREVVNLSSLLRCDSLLLLCLASFRSCSCASSSEASHGSATDPPPSLDGDKHVRAPSLLLPVSGEGNASGDRVEQPAAAMKEKEEKEKTKKKKIRR